MPRDFILVHPGDTAAMQTAVSICQHDCHRALRNHPKLAQREGPPSLEKVSSHNSCPSLLQNPIFSAREVEALDVGQSSLGSIQLEAAHMERKGYGSDDPSSAHTYMEETWVMGFAGESPEPPFPTSTSILLRQRR